MEEQEGLDSRAQQSRLSSKQFARINLITIVYRAHATKQKDWGICKAVPVGVKGKLKSWNGQCSSRRCSKMLADVGDGENVFKVSAC